VFPNLDIKDAALMRLGRFSFDSLYNAGSKYGAPYSAFINCLNPLNISTSAFLYKSLSIPDILSLNLSSSTL